MVTNSVFVPNLKGYLEMPSKVFDEINSETIRNKLFMQRLIYGCKFTKTKPEWINGLAKSDGVEAWVYDSYIIVRSRDGE